MSFSLAGYFFNRQLHFLVAGQRVPAILSNFPSNLSNQFFQPFQLLLRCFLAKADPDAGDENTHFQQAVVDAGMGGILWVSYLAQRQVGGDDQRLPAAVSAVHDVVDLFQCVFGATFHAEVVNDEQGITTELVHNIVPPGKAAVQLVQDSGEVRHTHRHLLLHQSVRNAPGKETLACTHTAPEEQS